MAKNNIVVTIDTKDVIDSLKRMKCKNCRYWSEAPFSTYKGTCTELKNRIQFAKENSSDPLTHKNFGCKAFKDKQQTNKTKEV